MITTKLKNHKMPKTNKDLLFKFPDVKIPPWEFAKDNNEVLKSAYDMIEHATGTRKYWPLPFGAPSALDEIFYQGLLAMSIPYTHSEDGKDLRLIPGENHIAKVHEGIYSVRVSLLGPAGNSSDQFLMIAADVDKLTMEQRLDVFLRFLAKEIVAREKKEEKIKQNDTLRRLILPSQTKQDIIAEIESFIKGKQAYTELGLQWKRGIVLYGPAGNGKTSAIRAISNYFGLQMMDLSRRLNQGGEPCLASESCAGKSIGGLDIRNIVRVLYPKIRKPILYYLEDLDKQVAGGNGTDIPKMRLSSLLNVIDGVDEIDGALFIATTNYANELAEALMSRPGRFDSIYEIGLPEHEQIMEMFNLHKLTVNGQSPEKLARDLKGYSMAFIEECVKVAKMIHKTTDLSAVQAASVLKKIHEHNAKYRKHFKDSGVGFTG